jgi:hypothetical protein
MDITVIYRILHPKATEYIFFSAVHGIFSKIGHILGHKESLNKHKKIKITPYVLPRYNRINYKSTERELQKIYKHIKIEQYTLE